MNSNKNISISDLILALMSIGIPFTIKLGNISLIIGFLYTLYLLIISKGKLFKEGMSFKFVFPMGFFLIVLASTFYSKDVASGLKQVEKNMLFPLIVLTLIVINSTKQINIRSTLKVFSLSTLVCTLILVFIGITRIFNGEGIEVLFFHELGSFFDLHPVYMAINLCITTLFITDEYLIREDYRSKKRFIIVLVLAFSIFALFLCASKAVIFCFAMLYCVQLYRVFRSLTYRAAMFTSILLISFVVVKTPKLADRFLQGLHFDISEFSPTNKVEEAVVFDNYEKSNVSDLELRYLMFKMGTFHVIDDSKLIFGYGIGDVQNHIDYYYMLYGLAPGWFEGYNLHNQYLQYLVTYGIFVFLFFCAYIYYSARLAILNKNQLHLFFLILISIIFLFECLLSRNKGIVIFIFLNTLFLILYKNENSYNRHKGHTQ
ncbi:O-antigen ligase family protein [uncultured Croceitalea sp.]|uniref:O-antigen ligase family protein n=1 Tax=uncultured Croceitalea sp. TaxID=1798908 RepID=UPI00374F4BC5